MTTGLPVSNLINVQVILTPPLAQFPNLNTCLILGTSDVINVSERMRVYGSLSAVAVDFSTTDEEYLCAVLWFEQSPQPTSLAIGRWANAATSGMLIGGAVSAGNQLVSAWTPITDGAFDVTIDGVGPSQVGNLNFSAVGNLNAVAAVIESGFPGGSATCVWDAAAGNFIITSATTGVSSIISFLSAPNTGTDISTMLAMRSTSSGAYQADGVAAETAVEALAILDNEFSGQFYGVVVPSADTDGTLAVAAYIEASTGNQSHYFGVTTQDVAALSAQSTSDIAYRLKALGYNRTGVQYSSENAYAVVSALARLLTTNWGGQNTTITLMYKQEPGIVAENLTLTQSGVLKEKNCNVFVNYDNDTAIIQYGTSASGQFVDTVVGVDWLRGAIQTTLFNLLYGSSTKIPQTNGGNHILATGIESVCQQGVANGLLAPGIWNAGGFGQLSQGDYLQKGYYVYAPPISSQSPADRSARKSVPFQVAAKLAGAVHTVDVIVNVNQ